VNRIAPGLAVAAAGGCRTVVTYHTWKDISAAGRLNHNFSAIGVWSETMKAELLQQNTDIDPSTIKVVGCAHFDCVGRKDLLMPEQDVRKAIGAKPSSRLILFPASAPWVVPNEERYISIIFAAVATGRLSRDIQLVVRLNPMDNTNYLEDALKNISPEILITRPDWRWDKVSNWCFQRKTDLMLYNSILEYSVACVGIPSTVTVECSVADLPVINIGYDLPGPRPLNGSIRSFWDADFYKDVRDTGAAALANTPEEMIELIATACNDRNWMHLSRQQLLRAQLGIQPHYSVDITRKLINDLDY
jgi:hypothetical protein